MERRRISNILRINNSGHFLFLYTESQSVSKLFAIWKNLNLPIPLIDLSNRHH